MTDTRQVNSAEVNASQAHRNERDYRGTSGVARVAKANAKVAARRASRRAAKAVAAAEIRQG
jgi:hypothetical protein